MKLLHKLERAIANGKLVLLPKNGDAETCPRYAYFDPLTFAELHELVTALKK